MDILRWFQEEAGTTGDVVADGLNLFMMWLSLVSVVVYSTLYVLSGEAGYLAGATGWFMALVWVYSMHRAEEDKYKCWQYAQDLERRLKACARVNND